MRLSLRFLIPLLLALGAFAWAAVPLVDALMLRWFVRDLDIRANLIVNTVREPLGALVRDGSTVNIKAYFDRLTQDERIYAVGLCLPGLPLPVATPLGGEDYLQLQLLKNPTTTFGDVGLLMSYNLVNWFAPTNVPNGDVIVLDNTSEFTVQLRVGAIPTAFFRIWAQP